VNQLQLLSALKVVRVTGFPVDHKPFGT